MLRIGYLVIFLFSAVGTFAQTDAQVIKHSKRAGLIKRYRVVKLTKYLTKDLDEEQRALAIYTWITHNIKYDFRRANKWKHKDQSERRTLLRRKGVCSHYASLFHKMCEIANLESAVVAGYSAKELWMDYDPDDYHVADHAWNAVKINGQWHLLDATFGAGYVEKRKRIPRKLLKATLGIPYLKNKYRFKFAPTRAYYKVHPDVMVLTHLPISPMWQLKRDTIGIETFRKKPWERAYIAQFPKGGNYQFEDSIHNYKFEQHKLRWEGKSGNLFNDTNYRCMAFGEHHYVVDRTNQLGAIAPAKIDDLEGRIELWDTLFHSVKLTQQYANGAKKVEKIVHKEINKAHRNRNKQVVRENGKMSSFINSKKDFCLAKYTSLKKENIQLGKKSSLLLDKNEKLLEWEPKTNGKEELKQNRIVQLEQSIKTKLAQANDLYQVESEVMSNYLLLQDSVLISLMNRLNDTVVNLTGRTQKNQLTITEYNHNLDSAYFASRDIVNCQFANTKILLDSLFKTLIKNQKVLITELKKNTSQLNTLKKEIGNMIKELSSARPVDDAVEGVTELNKMIIRNNNSLVNLYDMQAARNGVLMSWLKSYRKKLSKWGGQVTMEKGTEQLRLNYDLKKEKWRHNSYMNELTEVKRESNASKSYIKKNISALNKEIKLREQEEE